MKDVGWDDGACYLSKLATKVGNLELKIDMQYAC